MIKNPLSIIAVVIGPATVCAASGGHHDSHHIPWNDLVIPQVANFLILFGALGYALRKPVKAFFSDRAESFQTAKTNALKALRAAEQAHQQIKGRLAELESTRKISLETAKKEAVDLKQKIIGEAKQLSERINQEARRTAEFELFKAKASLRSELLAKSVELADKDLSSHLDKSAQEGLRKDFLRKAGAARA